MRGYEQLIGRPFWKNGACWQKYKDGDTGKISTRKIAPGVCKMLGLAGLDGKLSYRKRSKLRSNQFCLPAQRKYPVPDCSHANNALSRATAAHREGYLSKSQYRKVTACARRAQKRHCNGGLGFWTPAFAGVEGVGTAVPLAFAAMATVVLVGVAQKAEALR
jgi:hypothetical protein